VTRVTIGEVIGWTVAIAGAIGITVTPIAVAFIAHRRGQPEAQPVAVQQGMQVDFAHETLTLLKERIDDLEAERDELKADLAALKRRRSVRRDDPTKEK
jgi:hypothetical protein